MERSFELTPDDIRLLRAMQLLLPVREDGFQKCSQPLRLVLKETGRWTPEAESAVCNEGDEEPVVKHLYDSIRRLISWGLVDGKGYLELKEYAGPRYTECRISSRGIEQLESLQESN